MKHVAPSIRETAFNCPHCNALTTQYWYKVFASGLGQDNPVPSVFRKNHDLEGKIKSIHNNGSLDYQTKTKFEKFVRRKAEGRPFLEKRDQYGYGSYDVENLSVSCCYNCDQISVWVAEEMIFPRQSEFPAANPDMPNELKTDYEEAGFVLEVSPRSSAALLRLVIQKLCIHLGERGKNINEDIKNLIAKGLDPKVGQALDAVRVIGNNAVHPLEMDLRDDKQTALSLFGLVNIIVDKMISQPKQIEEVYKMLPEGAIKAIEKRDRKS